jgi:hypothetical protein
MNVDAALVSEQGVTFVVVVVQNSVLSSPTTRTATAAGFAPYWPGVPIVLMAQDARGAPEYWGRTDLAQFLASVPVESLPWRSWTIR